jgi:hypothetical protein
MGFAMCVANLGIVPAITSVTREKLNEYFICKDS